MIIITKRLIKGINFKIVIPAQTLQWNIVSFSIVSNESIILDLCKSILKVGRSSTCDIIIDQTKIKDNLKQIFSKEHFCIYKDSDNLVTYITDNSKSGTFLNGSLIGKRNSNILQHDDIISIGGPKIKCKYTNLVNLCD